MIKQISETNLNTLAHATELATKVILNVAGEAVSTTVNGEILTSNQIKHSIAAKMQGCFITGEGSKA